MKNVKKIFEAKDNDNNGYIDFEEFCEAIKDKMTADPGDGQLCVSVPTQS